VTVNYGVIWSIDNGTGTDLDVNGILQNSGGISYSPSTVTVNLGSGSIYKHSKDGGGILSAT
jgi:hypothetical protein